MDELLHDMQEKGLIQTLKNVPIFLLNTQRFIRPRWFLLESPCDLPDFQASILPVNYKIEIWRN